MGEEKREDAFNKAIKRTLQEEGRQSKKKKTEYVVKLT